jgi:hypothetical protein
MKSQSSVKQGVSGENFGKTSKGVALDFLGERRERDETFNTYPPQHFSGIANDFRRQNPSSIANLF